MGSWLLLRDAATIAMDLQLRLPPLNAEALLQRFCFDLALPLVTSCPPSALSLILCSLGKNGNWSDSCTVCRN